MTESRLKLNIGPSTDGGGSGLKFFKIIFLNMESRLTVQITAKQSQCYLVQRINCNIKKFVKPHLHDTTGCQTG